MCWVPSSGHAVVHSWDIVQVSSTLTIHHMAKIKGLKIGKMGMLSGLLNEEDVWHSCIAWCLAQRALWGQKSVCWHQYWAHSLCFHKRETESLKRLRREVPFEFERMQLFGFFVIFCCLLAAWVSQFW